jgi:sugar/nucleoside kinase (ribokinase family)
MYENDGSELLALMKKVKQTGCATSLDLAAVDSDSEAGKADWDLILSRVLPYVDFFEPSVEELCFMLDKPRFKEWQERAAGNEITNLLNIDQDVKPLARKCMEYGAKVLLVKCGAPGMYYCTGDKAVLASIGERVGLDSGAWANKEGFETSFVPEQILSGTGAGDTSIAAFLTSMLEGDTIEECMRLAVATGASCVSAYDALSGLKTLDELKKKIADGWKKVDRKEG